MNVQELLRAFDELSAEDREAVRTEILSKRTEASCCSGEMKEKLSGMMQELDASVNPVAMCMEMMRMCHERTTTRKAR